MTKPIAALSGVLCSALLLSGCSLSDGDGAASRTSRLGSEWDEKAGAPEVAAFMKIDVPADAEKVKAAVAVNPQEDNYLLSFVTSERAAERLAEDLHSPEPLRPQAAAKTSSTGNALFRHLGLTPPDLLRNVRWVGVCPPCVVKHGRGRVQWIEMFVHAEGKGRARVYLQAF